MRSFCNDIKSSGWWPFAIIGLLVTFVYIPTFSGEFILDDHALIENNPYIKGSHSLASYFVQEDGIVSNENRPEEHTGYYRPLANVTYRLDYKVWGMKPQGFRATNFILHVLTSFVLYGFILLLAHDRQIAFWASLLYAVHPVNTEAVSWTSGRNNLLVTLFFLSSLYYYIKGWEEAGRLSSMASVLFYVLAVLSKEYGLILVPCIFLYHRFLTERKGRVRDEVISYLPFLLLGLGYFVLRKMVTGGWLTPSEPGNLWERIYFFPYLIAWNLKIIFLPYNLHNFIVHYPSNYVNRQVLAGLLCAALLGLLIWRTWGNRLATFSILSFLAALLPISNIVHISAVTLVSMRWLYFPMIFVSLGVTQAIKKPMKIHPTLTTTLLCLIVAYAGAYSYVLNRCLWKDEASFFTTEVIGFDNFFHAGGLAENLLDEKDHLNAEKYFQVAIEKYPKAGKNYINYSALLVHTGRPEAAISVLNKAKSLPMTSREHGEWYNNMGTAYFHLTEYEEAASYFKEAVDSWPSEFQFWSNLGAAYGSLGDYTNAASALERGLNLAPDSTQMRKDLAVVYRRMGRPARAVSVLQKIPHDKLKQIGAEYLLDKALKESTEGCQNRASVKP